MNARLILSIGLLFAATTSTHAQGLVGDELSKALSDKAAKFWIYDDFDAAKKLAEKTGKPLLISFRCVP